MSGVESIKRGLGQKGKQPLSSPCSQTEEERSKRQRLHRTKVNTCSVVTQVRAMGTGKLAALPLGPPLHSVERGVLFLSFRRC